MQVIVAVGNRAATKDDEEAILVGCCCMRRSGWWWCAYRHAQTARDIQISHITPQVAAACEDLAGGGVLLPPPSLLHPPTPHTNTFLDYTHVL